MQLFGIFRIVFFKVRKNLLPFFFTFLSLFFVIPSLINFFGNFKRLMLPFNVFSSEFNFFFAEGCAMAQPSAKKKLNSLEKTLNGSMSLLKFPKKFMRLGITKNKDKKVKKNGKRFFLTLKKTILKIPKSCID